MRYAILHPTLNYVHEAAESSTDAMRYTPFMEYMRRFETRESVEAFIDRHGLLQCRIIECAAEPTLDDRLHDIKVYLTLVNDARGSGDLLYHRLRSLMNATRRAVAFVEPSQPY